MTCNICGSPLHEVTTAGCPNQGMGVVEYERFLFPPKRMGWTCSACGKGNAPDVKGCVHCAGPSAPLDATSNMADWASGKFSIGQVGD